MKYLSIIILLSIIFTSALFAQKSSDILKPDLGNKLGACSICGMDVYEKMITRVDLMEGDSTDYACGLGCASALMQKKQYFRVYVYDYKKTTMIPMDAFYVFGSRITPVQAMLPVFSFSTKESAEEFQKLNGGKILYGKEAFDLADKIRKERMSRKKENK